MVLCIGACMDWNFLIFSEISNPNESSAAWLILYPLESLAVLNFRLFSTIPNYLLVLIADIL
jgi:hypothetical protein